MAEVLVNETYLTDIADAIREKNGTTDTYKPREMAAAISSITTGSGDSGESSSSGANCAVINGYTISSTSSGITYKWDISSYVPNNTTPFYVVMCFVGQSSTITEISTDVNKTGIAYYIHYDGSTFTQLGTNVKPCYSIASDFRITASGMLTFFSGNSTGYNVPNMRRQDADPNNIIIFY